MNDAHGDTDRHTLDQAATLLDQLGRTAKDPAVGIRALAAAELLIEAGAESDLGTLPEDLVEERSTLDEVLRLLGSLDIEVLDDDRLLEAMQHALFAHWATR